MAAITEQLDTLYTTTWQSMKSKVSDQIFDATPYYFWLRSKGKLRTLAGGRWIGEPVQKAKYDETAWVVKGQAVSLSDNEILETAKFEWRYLVNSIVRFWQDDQQNRSKHQIINLMNAKMSNAKQTLIDLLETALFAGSGSASNAIDGLQHLVSDTAAYATAVGGITPSTDSWWQNKVKDMTGLSFATHGIKEMRTMLNNVSNNLGSSRPDILLTGQTPYEYYAETMLGYYQFTDRTLVDAGFRTLEFEGIPLVWSPSCGTRIYFLNTEHIWLYYDPAYFFEMTPFKTIPDQPHDRAAQITAALSHVTNRRRAQGVMHTIDTP